MEITVCNIAKSMLETIDINITEDNTTWFKDIAENRRVQMLTDIEGCLLISEYNYDYPVLIYDVTRNDIDCNINKALKLKEAQT